MIVQILDNLLLASLEDVQLTSNLIKKDVKVILTIDQRPLMKEFYHETFIYKHIPVLDVDSEDLLSILDDTFSFIEKARCTDDSTIVVHWYVW